MIIKIKGFVALDFHFFGKISKKFNQFSEFRQKILFIFFLIIGIIEE